MQLLQQLFEWRKPVALLEPISAESILQQTKWPVGFFHFPDEGRSYQLYVEYFNPTIALLNGRRTLITRRRVEECQQYGRNSIWSWALNGLTPVNMKKVAMPKSQYLDHHEDPRATQCPDGSVLLSWCEFRWPWHRTYTHQAYGILRPHGVMSDPQHLVYGKNGPSIITNNGFEKNWTWFFYDQDLMCQYIPAPEHVVLSVAKNRVRQIYKTDSRAAQSIWQWGEIRGGTPPVRVGSEYICFLHSSLPWLFKNGRWFNRYYMGAIAFKAEPPFPITRITRKPLLEGSKYDPRNEGAPLCVFPGGALWEGNSWMLVFGVNDCRCAWMQIPHEDLLRSMVPV